MHSCFRCFILTIVWSQICITSRNLILAKSKAMLTSELRFPVTQGLLLGSSEVRKVVILILQCFFIQAKCGKAPGCISSGKDPVWPLFKNKMKPKTDSLLHDTFSVAHIHRSWLLCSQHWEPPFKFQVPFLSYMYSDTLIIT